ncbi:unnamed protein product [Acanthoscelides obtectus]|uniref:Uncharacterized protein n=1 Tax=Acanthoscelides obtectus TaxID=200917 RepID=A0A9P0PGA0_ACAOB|nr:unnamed protein product [Acanthoscelides obtectus]CAK1638228.1 hypothetical protein AOBTE_LOCUS10467 [Acanthoscelides obtectus]
MSKLFGTGYCFCRRKTHFEIFAYRMLFCGPALCLQIGKIHSYGNSTEILLRHMEKTAQYSNERTYEG